MIRTAGRGGRAARAVALFVAVALLVGGCGMVQKTRRMFGGQLLIEPRIAPDLNRNFPLAVDAVVVYDKELLAEVSALPATDWFDQREQWVDDHPGELDVRSWEWVPDAREPLQLLEFGRGAHALVVWADYYAPGDHRVVIEPLRAFTLDLGETGFETVPLEDVASKLQAEKEREKLEKRRAKEEKQRARREAKEAKKTKEDDR